MPWKVGSVDKGIFLIGAYPWRFWIGKKKVLIDHPTILFCHEFYIIVTSGFLGEGDLFLFSDGDCSSCLSCSGCLVGSGGPNEF